MDRYLLRVTMRYGQHSLAFMYGNYGASNAMGEFPSLNAAFNFARMIHESTGELPLPVWLMRELFKRRTIFQISSQRRMSKEEKKKMDSLIKYETQVIAADEQTYKEYEQFHSIISRLFLIETEQLQQHEDIINQTRLFSIAFVAVAMLLVAVSWIY